MVISRLLFLLSLIIGVLIIHRVCSEKIESSSVDEPSEQESDVGKATEKVVEEGSSQQDDGKLVKEESTKTDDATTLEEEKEGEEPAKVGEEEEKVQDSYGEGSVCVYCQYCKFCKLCNRDCPCKKSKKSPNCHMCKYCKYCYLCESVCDNFCKPGSFLDTISSAVWSALPKFDNKMKGEVDKDIESVKNWIKDYL